MPLFLFFIVFFLFFSTFFCFLAYNIGAPLLICSHDSRCGRGSPFWGGLLPLLFLLFTTLGAPIDLFSWLMLRERYTFFWRVSASFFYSQPRVPIHLFSWLMLRERYTFFWRVFCFFFCCLQPWGLPLTCSHDSCCGRGTPFFGVFSASFFLFTT